ncbi:hypothetical protein K0B96_00645 [Horticoccus luteus]|uniref:Uncharacterized protein n=1 Tax=Horticoccus luteus TaxID=2862869 RepID=A0A8F9TU78_9BACT|nr:hypothetical protein [Horticoccus luteus]QYM79156.1 hypothetical protein K0B96_00645 [Horticoccus luteus]
MQDHFTGKPTCIRGDVGPGAEQRAALQHDHERRLEALARLGAAAAQCGVGTDSDGDLVLLADDEVSLLEGAGGEWAALGAAIHHFRELLPLRELADFGFAAGAENPLEEPNEQLRRIGGGVEAWAFLAPADGGSVYKFFLPRELRRIGSAFGFQAGEESTLLAEATLGDYRALLEKLLLIHALDGMATEVIGVTTEGVLVAKQVLGEPLPQGEDVSRVLPAGLIEIPSRFLRANRDHPRLFFLRGQAFLVADLHARNFVRGAEGALHVIDLVAAPWPRAWLERQPLMADWLERVRADPGATLLAPARDEDL